MDVSVVIAWVNPLELIRPGIDSLKTQKDKAPSEIIVVTRHNTAAQQQFRKLFPDVTLIAEPAGTPIPRLRSIGIRRAQSEAIAITEDHCVPAANWIAGLAQHMEEGSGVAGGPVENASTVRMRDWAAFLTEYSGAIRPGSACVSNALPGNNVVYRREFAGRLCETLDRGLWESFYHEELAREGVRMLFDPNLIVYHRRPFDFWYFIGQRYHFCRSFAGMRCLSFNSGDRLKYALGTVLLPPLLFARAFLRLMERRRLMARFLMCSPLIGVYMMAGAFGEMIGYCAGGGVSLERVE